ncbi:MAG: ribosome biogenesis GTP-binding protein YsxC, partial [Oscillospiraceae bacterium]|nr:ribosome biogenesis GTP-binding protein YsxC [Oscillospiraceae bacterium]
AQPGKTVTVNFYNVNDFHMVDLPGYGFAKVGDKDRKRWGKPIDGYFEYDLDLRLVVQLIDCRHEPSKDDYTMLDYLTVREIPFIIALTKADKLNKTESEKVVAKFEEYCSNFNYYKIILTSSDKGTGIEELKDIFEEVLADDYEEDEE